MGVKYLTERDVKIIKEKIEQYEEELQSIYKDIENALQEGDLSENSAYETAKNRKEERETTVKKLKEDLMNIEIVENRNQRTDIVGIGVSVSFKDDLTGEEFKFKFVGDNMGRCSKRTMSRMSPVGKAIYNKSVGDTVRVRDGSGNWIPYTITKIEGGAD